MAKLQTPYGEIDVDANGVIIDTPATRAAMAASNAANPQAAGANGTPFAYQGSPGTPGDPGYTPDYGNLIATDPLYLQNQANLKSQSVNDAASRKASTDQALINFGEIPDFNNAITGLGLDPNSPMYKMLFGDVDPATQTSAQGLTNAGLSTVAQLAQGHKKNLNDLMDNLAARGIVRSGATGAGTGLENQSYLGNQFNARNTLLQYLAGVQSAFTQSENARQSQLAQSATDAMTRQMQLHPYVAPTAGTEGTGIFAPGYVPPPLAPAPAGPADLAAAAAAGHNVPLPPATVAATAPPQPIYSNSPSIGYTAPPQATIPAGTSRADAQSIQNSLVRRLNLPE